MTGSQATGSKRNRRRGCLLEPGVGGTAARLSLHSRLPFARRIDVFPFLILYAAAAYLHTFCVAEGELQYSPSFLSDAAPEAEQLNATDTTPSISNPISMYSFVGYWLFPATVVLQLAAFFLSQWSIDVLGALQYSPLPLATDISTFRSKATAAGPQGSTGVFVKAVPKPHCGSPRMCPLINERGRIFFSFQQTKYVWDKAKQSFSPLAYPIDRPVMSYYQDPGLRGGLVTEAVSRYGENRFAIPLPSFLELFQEHAVAPFFVFQMFCVALWLLDEYWYYSLMTLAMLVLFEAQVVQRRIQNLQKLRAMRTEPFPVYVHRHGDWERVASSQLVPGDIIELDGRGGGGVCPCDCLLLSGSCVVNEAMLTGESVPQAKEAFPSAEDEKAPLDIASTHKRAVVFGGTRVMLASPGKPKKSSTKNKKSALRGERGCVAYVLRTGFGSAQGSLVRTILFSTERVSVNSAEGLWFILFLLIFAVVASAYVLLRGLEDESRSRYKLMLNCIMIVTSVVPPELPIELSLAVNMSLLALSKAAVFCTEPFRIPIAGSVDTCCFDKTGTLTSDKFRVEGVSDPSPSDPSLSTPRLLPPAMLRKTQVYALVGCQSLVFAEGQGVLGDPMEKALLQSVGWRMSRNQSVYPASGRASGGIDIQKRFPFSSALQRMATLIRVRSTQEYWIAAKGSPEAMAPRIRSLPPHYHETHKYFSRKGRRVLALAFRQLGRDAGAAAAATRTRADAEKDLDFGGFIVLHCPLKPFSRETISQLNASSHDVTMITGDHTLTACHVAHELQISQKQYPSHSLVLEAVAQDDNNSAAQDEKSAAQGKAPASTALLLWRSVDEKTTIEFGSEPAARLAERYDLCLSGGALAALEAARGLDAVKSVIPSIRVFARFSPRQKEFVLTTMKNAGKTTLMCGDGTNDVGALKQAHVGVALISRDDATSQRRESDTKSQNAFSNGRMRNRKKQSQKRGGAASSRNNPAESLLEDGPGIVRLGDASIASPFTSQVPFVISVVNIIRQGRCTLVTTYQMYRILALNCLISAYSMSVLYLDGVKYGDWQMTVASLAITMFFFFISQSKPLDQLSQERPPAALFTISFFFEILGQFAVHLLSLIAAVQAALPHTPQDKDTRDPDGDFKPNALNSAVFLVSTSMTVATFLANYRGKPFMTSLFDNKRLLYSLLITEAVLLVCAIGLLPPLGHLMELSPNPTYAYGFQLAGLMVADLVVSVGYTRGVRWTFRS